MFLWQNSAAYAMKPESGVIDENATAKQIADKLAAPTVKADQKPD